MRGNTCCSSGETYQMAIILSRERLLHLFYLKNYPLQCLLASAFHRSGLTSNVGRELFLENNNGRFQAFDVLRKQYQVMAFQHFSTTTQHGRLGWECSSRDVLLRKLEISLKDHRLDEAWVAFKDFKGLYGFPTGSILSRLITELSYASKPHWQRKASDLVLLILEEKSGVLEPDILAKLLLSLARAQMPICASKILRVMLERGNLLPLNILYVVVFHMVKTNTGTCLASNFLVQVCEYFLNLGANRVDHVKVMKPDTVIFNLVLDACVRFKLSLKGQQMVELMSEMGVVADAHSIIIIAQIHEMNGQRDEIKKLKHLVDRACTLSVSHYQHFYDSLLSLHFNFDDIDSAVELVLDMHKSQDSVSIKKLRKDEHEPAFVSIGSHNLKAGLKIQIVPELLQKDSILKVENKEELVICRNRKLLLSNKALAKFINTSKKHGRMIELAKLLLVIQKDYHALGGTGLCSDVVDACIHLGLLETAHDILDDMEAIGAPTDSTAYLALLRAYHNKDMFKEAKALQRQMKKANLFKNLSDEMVVSVCLPEPPGNASSYGCKSDLANFLIQEMREEEAAVPSVVYELNSSIYFFCKAKMLKDAFKTYRKMQEMKIHPTVQTFAYLVNCYSSLEKYRDITILWGDMKRNMESWNLEVTWDLYEILLLNFLRGGYFERVMEVVGYMQKHNMYTDKWMYKSEFLKLHKNLYRSLKASDARTEAQSKRLEYVQTFRRWAGID